MCFLIGVATALVLLAELRSSSFNLKHHLATTGLWLLLIVVYLAGGSARWRWALGIPYHLCMFTLAAHMFPGIWQCQKAAQVQFLACLFRFMALPLANGILPVAFWSTLVSAMVLTNDQIIGASDILFTVVTIMGYWWLNRATELATTLDMEMADLRSMRCACHTLLSSVYDVVVELDDSLNIAEDVHCCLGTWLRHGRKVLEGQDIQQFMHSDLDRETFLREVGRENYGTVAAAFHLKMQDGSGMAIPAECFHARFQSDSEERYLLAFREFSDNSMPINAHDGERCSELTEEIKEVQMSGGVALLEFSAMDFQTLGASSAFCDLFHGQKELYNQVTDYVAKHALERFLQDVMKNSNELLHSKASSAEGEAVLPLMVQGHICQCACRLTFYKASDPLHDVSAHSLGLTEDQTVIVKLFVMRVLDKPQESQLSRRSSSRRSSSSRSSSQRSHSSRSRSPSSRSPALRRELRQPECGDLREWNRSHQSHKSPPMHL